MLEEPKSNPSSRSKADEVSATRAWAERWLSQKRLAPYLAACGVTWSRHLISTSGTYRSDRCS